MLSFVVMGHGSVALAFVTVVSQFLSVSAPGWLVFFYYGYIFCNLGVSHYSRMNFVFLTL